MTGKTGSSEEKDGIFRPQCSNHPSLPASYMCQHCGDSICSYCQRNTDGLPLCPKCFRKHLDRRMKRRSLLLKIVPTASVLLIIGLILTAVLWPEPERDPRPGELHVGSDDIIPSIDADDIQDNTSLPIMFILYVKNYGELPTDPGFVEISLLKGGIQWDIHQENVPGISAGGMSKVVVTGFDVREGSWTGRISLWRGDVRDQVVSISFKVTEGDIEEFHSSVGPGVPIEPTTEDKEDASLVVFPLLCGILIIVGILVAVMVLSGVKGYAKISSGQVLNHPTRNLVIDYLKDHPGAHFKSISRGIAVPPGTLRHHLNTLEREGLVRSSYEGMFRRYFPTGAHLDPARMEAGNRNAIIEVLGMYPGISQNDLRSIVSIPKQTLSYHLKRLQEEGRIRKEKKGSGTSVFLQPVLEAS
ncbi:MAG: winged helix-turn-helix transcriptional regulator [Thermoplasmatota archaeon]